MSRRRRTLSLLPGIAIAVGLSACGTALPPLQESLPNVRQIQTAIQGSILAHDHTKAKVLCPTQVPLVKDEVFSCVAVAPKGRTFTFTVTETGTGDYVTFRQAG